MLNVKYKRENFQHPTASLISISTKLRMAHFEVGFFILAKYDTKRKRFYEISETSHYSKHKFVF